MQGSFGLRAAWAGGAALTVPLPWHSARGHGARGHVAGTSRALPGCPPGGHADPLGPRAPHAHLAMMGRG